MRITTFQIRCLTRRKLRIYFEHALFHRLSHSWQAIIGFDQISPSASSIRDLGLWDGLGSLGSISNKIKYRAKLISDRSNIQTRPQCERGLFMSTTGERKYEKSVCSSTESEMTERSRETWASLRRWLVFSVLQPYSAHLYDIFSTDDVNFISHSIMIEQKINLSFMFVTCLPPRYSPQIDTNEKSCSFASGTFRSISQIKIGIKFHNTVLPVHFSLSLLFLLVLSHNVFF